ncbi:MAG: ATP-binding protein [Phycisphaerales bacterium]
MLERQLKHAGVRPDAPPDQDGWSRVLTAVSRAYTQADQDRYLLERSLALSSAEMQELNAKLRAEHDTITTVTYSLAEGVCAVDEQGVVQFINPEGVRLLGLASAAEARGRRLQDLVSAVDSQGLTLAEALTARTPTEGEGERLIVNGDESAYIVHQRLPLVGERSGLVITLRDISERRRHEREREELHRQLVDVSRQAGMAEVASGVLHNVGNVLNSVNVSASMAADRMQRTSLSGLERISALLTARADDLVAFVRDDPAGRRLPEYLTALAEALHEDHMAVSREIDSLIKSVEHIKEVVSAQQASARLSGLREREDLTLLIEEALRLVSASFARHSVDVVREFGEIPSAVVERHQVLQILVNLLTNANHAMAHRPAQERVLTLRTSVTSDGEWIRVDVQDTGVGIEPDTMTRIFSHGFTTRKDGHGFGLHIAALAAKGMGGTLRVRSEGKGRGATFTLEIPAGASLGAAA